MTGPAPIARTQLTIYALMDEWLLRLAEGWRLCGLAPEPIRAWSVLMFRWEPLQERVAYRGTKKWNHK